MLPMFSFAQFGADYSSYGFNFVNDTFNDGLGGWEGTEIGNPQFLNIYRQNDTINDYALELKALNQTVQISYDDTGYMDLNPCSFIVNLRLNVTQYTGGQDRFSFKLQTSEKLVDIQFQNDGIYYLDDSNNTNLITTAPIANEWLTYTISLDGCGAVGGLMIENDSTNIFPLSFPNDNSTPSIELSAFTDSNTEFKAEVDHLFIYSNPIKWWLGPAVVYDDETNFEGTTGDRQHYLNLPNGESIGINENAGGYVTFTELFPGGPNLDPRPKFGSGGTKTLRGYFHSSEYNPLQSGAASTTGGHLVTVNDLTTKLEIERFPLHLFQNSGMTENTPLIFPTGEMMYDNDSSVVDLDIYDEFGLDMRHELITELDFLSSIENVTETDEISIVKHQGEWEFVRHPCQLLQYHEPVANPRYELDGVPHSDADMGEMRHKFEFRVNKDLGYEWVLWREDGEWQSMELLEIGNNKTYNTFDVENIPFERRFMVFSTSDSLTDPNAIAWYYPESDYNVGSSVQKSRTDKSIISQEDRRFRVQIIGDWRKSNWCRLNLYIFNKGLLAPNHGDPNEYESFRMEAYQLFGTPEQIWDKIQGGITSTEDDVVLDKPKINVYPNPTNGMVHIQLNGLVVEKMTLLDNLGNDLTNNVQSISEDEEGMTLNLERLPTGIYYLVLNDDVVEKVQRK